MLTLPPGSVRLIAALSLVGAIASAAITVRTGFLPTAFLAIVLLFLSAGLAGMTIIDRLFEWIQRTSR